MVELPGIRRGAGRARARVRTRSVVAAAGAATGQCAGRNAGTAAAQPSDLRGAYGSPQPGRAGRAGAIPGSAYAPERAAAPARAAQRAPARALAAGIGERVGTPVAGATNAAAGVCPADGAA